MRVNDPAVDVPVLEAMRICYFKVADVTYPRNELVRSQLINLGATVTLAGSSSFGFRFSDFREARRAAKHSDFLVLSEFQLKHALVARLSLLGTNTDLIVDGFVGRYESVVEDQELASPRSLRAMVCRIIDHVAFKAAKIYLVDTKLRAERLGMRYHNSSKIWSLPVGFPTWAINVDPPSQRPRSNGILNVLYYGNYLPLNGIEFLARGVIQASKFVSMRVIMIGEGDDRPRAEELLTAAAGKSLEVAFLDPVPAEDLSSYLSKSQIVFGIFGASPKAESVIANKVWQGLASGSRVITRESLALDEIIRPAGEFLIQVKPGSSEKIADAIQQSALQPAATDQQVHDMQQQLTSCVDLAFKTFAEDLRRRRMPKLAGKRPSTATAI